MLSVFHRLTKTTSSLFSTGKILDFTAGKLIRKSEVKDKSNKKENIHEAKLSAQFRFAFLQQCFRIYFIFVGVEGH